MTIQVIRWAFNYMAMAYHPSIVRRMAELKAAMEEK